MATKRTASSKVSLSMRLSELQNKVLSLRSEIPNEINHQIRRAGSEAFEGSVGSKSSGDVAVEDCATAIV